jgi:hypothetical protein
MLNLPCVIFASVNGWLVSAGYTRYGFVWVAGCYSQSTTASGGLVLLHMAMILPLQAMGRESVAGRMQFHMPGDRGIERPSHALSGR